MCHNEQKQSRFRAFTKVINMNSKLLSCVYLTTFELHHENGDNYLDLYIISQTNNSFEV